MKKILLISNESRGNRNFVAAFKTGYFIDDMCFLNTALYKLKLGLKYDLVVMEVGMPSYGVYSFHETDNDQKTGLVFYEREIKKTGIPTILWSWSDEFREDIISLNDPKLIFVQKELEDKHLLKAVRSFLK